MKERLTYATDLDFTSVRAEIDFWREILHKLTEQGIFQIGNPSHFVEFFELIVFSNMGQPCSSRKRKFAQAWWRYCCGHSYYVLDDGFQVRKCE